MSVMKQQTSMTYLGLFQHSSLYILPDVNCNIIIIIITVEKISV